ncbi:ABC transporter ATP-binding protein [Corynebacterium antarcticum]|uniref:ATP-binding cassette domain-containing protein n=1 Tax=Corynebacterium antarcticum TaxID=2800405 RepID=A0A9Q4CFR3_9CORY|nr:ATP-binding cassette domain-containing protein [Corynebacterium antarcticum]MCK7643282.1 ATP-binding cassette domain-containing protein [Corynebacterium antarcticum]MCX7492697.1 ATP-binding cassette domain-containing protein [Corynebacterium antarcticum]MCX7538812.1 ATP-binding cassette domain-containing protein [Corynebacterium antarcticum]MCX7541128.1 ATP-binding cassette domain-containing protein [Corynebacterium antarcticum]
MSAPARTRPRGGCLRLSGVTVARRGSVLIDDLSLTVRPGEVLGVSGPSGCGKTTLLRVISGLTTDFSGEITRPEGRIGMVFQEPRLLPWLTARANVELVLPDLPRGKRVATADSWLDRVGLGDAAELPPDAMSGGMRQRVSVARAMATEPALLLVDEPFAALDKPLARRLRRLLLDVITRDTVTVWVTHDPDEIAEVSTVRLDFDPPGEIPVRPHPPTTEGSGTP